MPQPPEDTKSGPASSAEGAFNAIRAELAAMRVLLQLRLPPRPPTPASPLVPAATINSSTGAKLASEYQLPHSLSPDSASAVALRASILEEVRSVMRDALTTASPQQLRRCAGSSSVGRAISHAALASRSEPLPAPRVLSVMAHRGDPAPWRGWSPSPTQSARPPCSPAVPVKPVDIGGLVSSADQTALPLPPLLHPSAPPPSPIRRLARRLRYGAQSGAGKRHTSQLTSIKPQHEPPRSGSQLLVMQEPTPEVQLHKQRRRPASTGRVDLDRPSCGSASGNFPVACACADCIDHYRPES